MCYRKRSGSRPPRGAVTLKLILTLGVLVIMLLATFEFAAIGLLRAALTHAATVAAREAGKAATVEPTFSAADLVPVVQPIVGIHCVTLSDTADSGTKIVLEMGQPSLPPSVSTWGDSNLSCDPPASPTVAEDEVRVTLCVGLSATPFCDALSFFGLPLIDNTLRASAVVKKEKYP